jgi:hypothetical protein
MKKELLFMKRNLILALLIPIPITLLGDYLISHLGGSDPTTMTMLYASLINIFIGFLMAEVGDTAFPNAFIKYLIIILYGGASILGIVSLYVPKVASFHNFKVLFLEHALFYLLWGGVYLSLLLKKKSSLLYAILPALLITAIYLLNQDTKLSASSTTLVRYIVYMAIGLFGVMLSTCLHTKLGIVILLVYIGVFLAFIVGPLFTTYPAYLTKYIACTYDLWAILGGMSAYGLSNQ